MSGGTSGPRGHLVLPQEQIFNCGWPKVKSYLTFFAERSTPQHKGALAEGSASSALKCSASTVQCSAVQWRVIHHVITLSWCALNRTVQQDGVCDGPSTFSSGSDQSYHSATAEEDHWVHSKNIGAGGFGVVKLFVNQVCMIMNIRWHRPWK